MCIPGGIALLIDCAGVVTYFIGDRKQTNKQTNIGINISFETVVELSDNGCRNSGVVYAFIE
jgi:hypothetical protein